MKDSTKILAAALGGYVLGRRKKFKLAVALGLYVAGKQLNLSPQKVAGMVMAQIGDSPQLNALRDQAQGQLSSVGKAAASAIIDKQAGNLADALQSRTARISGEVVEDDEDDDEDEAEDQAEDETEDQAEDTSEEEETSGSRSRSGNSGRRRAPAHRSGTGTSRPRRATAGSES